MERKLVTIQKIDWLKPIEGADKIELAGVKGWQCVVNKGDFEVGNMAVFCEIDSFLPIRPEFEFLRKSCYKKLSTGQEGFRLKTIRLKGQLSQGLLLPCTILGPAEPGYGIDVDINYAEILGVTKYDPPIPASLSGVVKGNFPTDIIPKTDQERIQNLPEYFEKYKDIVFEITEKLDGTSTTYYINNGIFGVCSRNLELKESDATQWKIARELNIEANLQKTTRNLAIQGELVGPGIQGNPLKILKVMFFVFDIYDIDNKKYLLSYERQNLCVELGLKHIPIVNNVVYLSFKDMNGIIEYANFKSIFGDIKREGIVFKSLNYVGNEIISFKVINNDYLLGEK